MEEFRPLILRVNPSSSDQEALDESVDSVVEFLGQFPSDERPIELAVLISKACNKLEVTAGPVEASRYHVLGFHALEEVQLKKPT